MVHEPDRPGQYDWWTDYDNFHGPVCDLLEDLKAESIIRFTGLGGTTAYQLTHFWMKSNCRYQRLRSA